MFQVLKVALTYISSSEHIYDGSQTQEAQGVESLSPQPEAGLSTGLSGLHQRGKAKEAVWTWRAPAAVPRMCLWVTCQHLSTWAS